MTLYNERDKLAVKRKLVELLINIFRGKAPHSALMNLDQMRKREFNESVESQIEREAATVETYGSGSHVGKM